MGNSQSYYLTSVSYGLVLARSPDGRPTGVVAQQASGSDDQKWVIEKGFGDTIALRCCSNGQYLHANGGVSGATVGVGEKQWWKISKDNVTPPHACSLSPVEYPNVFLNHYKGIHVPKGHPGMNVHMWQWEQPNEWCLAWYFMDTTGEFKPQGGDSSGESAKPAELESKIKDLEAREAAIVKREEESKGWETKEKDLTQRELVLADREKNSTALDGKADEIEQREATLAKKEEELAAREKKLQSSEQNQTAGKGAATGNEAQLKDIEQREATLKQREEDLVALDAKVKDIVQREAALRERERKNATRATSSEQKKGPMLNGNQNETAYMTRLNELERREAAVAKKEQDLRRSGGSTDAGTPGQGIRMAEWSSPFETWRSQAGAPSGHRIQMPSASNGPLG